MAEFASLVPFAIESLPQYLREQIGIFGWLDTQMPLIGYWLWTTAIGLLLSCAVLVGTRRHRVILVTLSLLSVVVFVVIAAAGVLPLGYNLQGRHVQAFTVCVPLFAAEVIYVQARSRLTINPRYLLAAFTSMAAVVQAIAWYANAHRYAVGDNGPLLFFAQSEWAPPLGWVF